MNLCVSTQVCVVFHKAKSKFMRVYVCKIEYVDGILIKF